MDSRHDMVTLQNGITWSGPPPPSYATGSPTGDNLLANNVRQVACDNLYFLLFVNLKLRFPGVTTQ